QSRGGTLQISVPSRRVDIQREEDLVEEVARMMGYETIPSTVPGFITSSTGRPKPSAGLDRSRSFMAAAGYLESINFPLSRMEVQKPFMEVFPSGNSPVLLDNPLVDQMDTLRVSLLPGLLECLARNVNRDALDLKLFEVGRVYREGSPATITAGSPAPRDRSLPQERPVLAAVASGPAIPGHWSAGPRSLDFSHLKGIVETFTWRVGGFQARVQPPGSPAALPFLAQGENALILEKDTRRGVIGRLRPDLASFLDLKGKIYVFEMDLMGVDPVPPSVTYKPLPRQPAARRDLALMVADDVPYERLQEIVLEQGRGLLEEVPLFDRYEGHSIPHGQVSLALHLVFRDARRTLTTAEVQEIQDRVVARLGSELGAVLRES
ncbi:MAG: hypothetical protein ACE5ID_11555, partial [Acidobacteriota bacterium]